MFLYQRLISFRIYALSFLELVNPGHFNSVSDCNEKIKPKVCLVETFLDGPKEVGGTCPSTSHKYRNHCCCESGCCWEGCKKKTPPRTCLNGVQNSQWVVNTTWFNGDKLFYQAVRNFKDKGIYYLYQLA